MEILKDIAQNLIAGNDEKVAEQVAAAIASEVPTVEILDDDAVVARSAAPGRLDTGAGTGVGIGERQLLLL